MCNLKAIEVIGNTSSAGCNMFVAEIIRALQHITAAPQYRVLARR